MNQRITDHVGDLRKKLALADLHTHHPSLIKGEDLIVVHLVDELVGRDPVWE